MHYNLHLAVVAIIILLATLGIITYQWIEIRITKHFVTPKSVVCVHLCRRFHLDTKLIRGMLNLVQQFLIHSPKICQFTYLKMTVTKSLN
jgi:hypothetical protein